MQYAVIECEDARRPVRSIAGKLNLQRPLFCCGNGAVCGGKNSRTIQFLRKKNNYYDSGKFRKNA